MCGSSSNVRFIDHASRVAIIIFSKSERLIVLSGEVEKASSISIICRVSSRLSYNNQESADKPLPSLFSHSTR